MMFFRWLASFLTSGFLDRVLSTVDKRIEAETDREKIKGEIIKEHYSTRADWMRSGGFWLCMMFAVPLAFWFTAVVIYSIFWCKLCLYPQPWSIAALPPPLDDWAGMMILSIFGVVGIHQFKKKEIK